MSEKVAVIEAEAKAIKILDTNEKLSIFTTKLVSQGFEEHEIEEVKMRCTLLMLDPLQGQITAVKYRSNKGPSTISYIIMIDGFRVIASRSGKYQGQLPTQWCGTDGKWVDVWLNDGPPAACRVRIKHTDFEEPIEVICKYSSFYNKNNAHIWDKMPEHMIAKCAEALAIRKAFPNDLANCFTNDEMQQSEQPPILMAAEEEVIKVFSFFKDKKISDEKALLNYLDIPSRNSLTMEHVTILRSVANDIIKNQMNPDEAFEKNKQQSNAAPKNPTRNRSNNAKLNQLFQAAP